MKINKYFLPVLLQILLISCTNERVHEEYFENGQLQEVLSYKGEEMHGSYVAYYKNRQIRAQGNYENGKMDGIWKNWFENGILMSEATYDDGQLISLQAWDINGDQTIKDCNGVAVLTYPDGSPMSQVAYRDCKPHGKWITWYENGQVESELYYENGWPISIWQYWNPDGTLRKVEKHNGTLER